MKELQEVINQEKLNRKRLLKQDNVIGVGVGFKERGGKKTDKLAVRVYVTKKVPIHMIQKTSQIESFLGKNKQIPTDVVEVGEIKIQPSEIKKESALKKILKKINIFSTDRLGKNRPLIPGTSEGNRTITAGTLGAAVYYNGIAGYTLSNAHVYCSDPFAPMASQDKVIFQPGPYDGGAINDKSGELVAYGQHPNIAWDGAVKKNDPGVDVYACAAGLSSPPTGVIKKSEITSALIGTEVIKSGRTTGVTTGTLTDINVTITVNYGTDSTGKQRNVTRSGQLLFSNISSGGDSGSLILRKSDMKALALLYAGSDTVTVGSSIDDVLGDLNCTLVTGEGGAGNKTVTVNFRLIKDSTQDYWTIEGQVTDSSTAKPICGAALTTQGKTAVTDSGGNFEFQEVNAGAQKITCTADGYLPQEQTITI